MSSDDAFAVRLRGDGRTYYMTLYVPTERTAFSYRGRIETKAGRWQEVRIPLKEFRATWFGRSLPNAAPIDPNEIRALGFTIADKKAGPFKLEVDRISSAGTASDESK